MFAQLGDIVFDPLAGFNSYSETDEAVIAQYQLITGKPLPVQTALGLRQISFTMRLHQAFIIVNAARLQLRAHKDQGDALTLTWGNGDVEGNFLIQSLQTEFEEMDGLGNLISCIVTVQLLEIPDGLLLTSKQGDSYKQAFAANPAAYPPVTFVAPEPEEPSDWQQFAAAMQTAVRLASMIDALSYGGQFPNLGQSLPAIIANASANMTIMQQLFNDSDFDNDDTNFDIGDVSGAISNVLTSLSALSLINPATNPSGFASANAAYQLNNDALCWDF